MRATAYASEPEPVAIVCAARGCAAIATATDPAGELTCAFHSTRCDCGEVLGGALGLCPVCDPICTCEDEDDTCAIHGPGPARPKGDLMDALKTAMGMGK